MRFVIIALLAFLLTFTQANDVRKEVVDTLEGILVGTFGEIGHEVQECIEDGELIFADIEHAVVLLKSALQTKSRADLIQAFQYIGDALVRIPSEVKDCEALPEVVKDIEKIAAEFLNPEALIIDIGEKIIWHGISIYHDVTNSVRDFEGGNFFQAGEDIGDIVRIIFLTAFGDPADNVVNFTKAFYQSAFKIKLSLETCKAGVAVSWNDVVAAIKQIAQGTVADIVAGVSALIKAVPNLMTSFEGCKADWPAIQEGLNDLMPFVNHPASIILAFSKAVAMDPISFPKDAYNFYSAMTSDPINYTLGGQSSGDIMSMVLYYMPHDTPAIVGEYLKRKF